jgi:hypothetical protein
LQLLPDRAGDTLRQGLTRENQRSVRRNAMLAKDDRQLTRRAGFDVKQGWEQCRIINQDAHSNLIDI